MGQRGPVSVLALTSAVIMVTVMVSTAMMSYSMVTYPVMTYPMMVMPVVMMMVMPTMGSSSSSSRHFDEKVLVLFVKLPIHATPF